MPQSPHTHQREIRRRRFREPVRPRFDRASSWPPAAFPPPRGRKAFAGVRPCVWHRDIQYSTSSPLYPSFFPFCAAICAVAPVSARPETRSEEHTSELQSRENLVCRLLLEKKKKKHDKPHTKKEIQK